MTAALILNQSQSEAVYSAMCALNNVGGTIKASLNEITGGTWTAVWENSVEGVRVVECKAYRVISSERYANQSDFATAYGLNSDEPQNAVAAAAGGLAQTAIER